MSDKDRIQMVHKSYLFKAKDVMVSSPSVYIISIDGGESPSCRGTKGDSIIWT